MKYWLIEVVLLLPMVAFSQRKPTKQSEVKIQKTSLTRDEELQLGKEAAAQGDSANLNGTTSEFVQSLEKGDPNLRAEKSTAATLGGKATLVTKLTTKTSAQQDQVIYLYTVAREARPVVPGAGRRAFTTG